METLLTTLVVLVVIVAALALLARGWPRSYTRGGYRNWSSGPGGPERTAQAEERGDIPREDDDDGWRLSGDQDARGTRSGGAGTGG